MERSRKHLLATVGDLDQLKIELLAEIRALIKAQNTNTTRRWMKSAEVRKFLGFSAGKLQAVREKGLLAYVKIGGNIYYAPEDLMKLFNENKVHGEGEKY